MNLVSPRDIESVTKPPFVKVSTTPCRRAFCNNHRIESKHLTEERLEYHSDFTADDSGSKIALSWLPMRLKILHWRPEFHSWLPHFPIWRLKKRSVTSWCLPKKVNFRPWRWKEGEIIIGKGAKILKDDAKVSGGVRNYSSEVTFANNTTKGVIIILREQLSEE